MWSVQNCWYAPFLLPSFSWFMFWFDLLHLLDCFGPQFYQVVLYWLHFTLVLWYLCAFWLSHILISAVCLHAEMTHTQSSQLPRTLELLPQICFIAPKICAQWKYTGMSRSTIRSTGVWSSQSQIVTYHGTLVYGIWLLSILTFGISQRLSVSVTSLWILMAPAAVSSSVIVDSFQVHVYNGDVYAFDIDLWEVDSSSFKKSGCVLELVLLVWHVSGKS